MVEEVFALTIQILNKVEKELVVPSDFSQTNKLRMKQGKNLLLRFPSFILP